MLKKVTTRVVQRISYETTRRSKPNLYKTNKVSRRRILELIIHKVTQISFIRLTLLISFIILR